jgi:uncharacterized protein (TIGR00369 family)
MTEENPLDKIFPYLKKNFEEMPFNKTVGMKLESITEDAIKVSVEMAQHLEGNQDYHMLHGGAISSIIDAAGGVMSMVGAYTRMNNLQVHEEEYLRLAKIGTIGLHVDYLRPGIGKKFICTASLLRAGGKVLSIRMELRNEKEELIAVGGGSFMH